MAKAAGVFLLYSLGWLVCLGQNKPSKLAKLDVEDLPQINISFKASDHGLPVPSQTLFLGQPFCSANGTIFLNARTPPDYGNSSILGISPNSEMYQYQVQNVPGLTHLLIIGMDAKDSDVLLLVSARKKDALGQVESQNPQHFLLYVSPGQSAPKVVPLKLPFQPIRAVIFEEDQYMVLGMDMINHVPAMALVDSSGDEVRAFDSQLLLGQPGGLVINASKQIRSQTTALPDDWAQLSFVLSTAQFVHQGQALVLLIPGRKNEVITFGQDGSAQTLRLHLPDGFEAESLVPSDKYLFVRVANERSDGKFLLLMVDPQGGDVMRVVRTPQLSAQDVLCVHDGEYLGIHWAGEKGKEQLYLMRGKE